MISVAGKIARGLPALATPKWIGAALLLIVLVLAYTASSRYFIHQQIYAQLRTAWAGDTAPGQNIWLPDYKVVIDGKVVESTLRNLSGITYDYDQNRLLAITNNTPMELLVLSKAGDIVSRYPLEGFKDTEGLAYLGHGRVVVADEDLQRLNVVTLPTEVRPIKADDTQFISLAINLTNTNKGFEGVTYDAEHDRLFAIKERDPRQLFEVAGMINSIGAPLKIKVADLTSWVDRSVFARDLSDGYYDAATGHMLILSDQSKSIIELDQDGNFVSTRSLRGGISDMKQSAPQAEGMTMDSDGNLYVVSEPNLFYQFKKQ